MIFEDLSPAPLQLPSGEPPAFTLHKFRYICRHTYINNHKYINTYIHKRYTYLYACTYVHIYIFTLIIHMYICTYMLSIHTCIHIHIYNTYTFTYANQQDFEIFFYNKSRNSIPLICGTRTWRRWRIWRIWRWWGLIAMGLLWQGWHGIRWGWWWWEGWLGTPSVPCHGHAVSGAVRVLKALQPGSTMRTFGRHMQSGFVLAASGCAVDTAFCLWFIGRGFITLDFRQLKSKSHGSDSMA